MGGQSAQQGSQVFYDPEMGQYYTQSPQQRTGSIFGNINGGTGDIFSTLFGDGRANRTYINGFGQSQAMQPQAPYEYANTSLESLFPMLQGQPMNQGGGNSAMSGLLGGSAPSATGSASSGAGRFM